MSNQCPVCSSSINEHDKTCPSCGFTFLESTQSFQPVTITSEDLVASAQKAQNPAMLRIIRGPQIEATFSLNDDEYNIGRNPQNEIFLNDMTVSREHARIRRNGSAYEIEDANSFNGVWVNNKSIETGILHDGDIVQIGAFCLLYQENNATS